MNSQQTLHKTFSWSRYLVLAQQPGRVPELDGVRAWAIILVLGHHFATFYREHHGSYFRQTIDGSLAQWLYNGWLGVDLFFVLSGYLIFRHLLLIRPNKVWVEDLKNYALKRMLRTLPLYYAMILIAFIGLIPRFNPEITVQTFVVHTVFLQDYLGADILTPMWSLATEEKFYVLAPLLLLLFRWSTKTTVLALMAFTVGILLYRFYDISSSDLFSSHVIFFNNYRAPFHYAVTSILVGVFVAVCEQKKILNNFPQHMILVLLALVIVVTLGVLIGVDLYHPPNWQWLSVVHFIVVMLFGVIIWGVIRCGGSLWLRFMTGRFMRVIAVLSYALYLVHFAVLPWVLQLHKHFISSETPWVHASSFLGMYLGVTVLISLALHYLVEKPFLIMKSKL